MSALIEVDYHLPAGVDGTKHAQIIAIGQTAGTWSSQWEHRSARLKAHLGDVRAMRTLVDGSTLATIGYPLANVEGDIGSLLTMIFGKYSMAGPAKVFDIRLPARYGQRPKYGVSGIRTLLGVTKRPLVMAIFKPALGLSASDHAQILAQVAAEGLDVIKDDEINANLADAPTIDRVKACREVIDRSWKDNRHRVLYAVNVTGTARALLENARKLVRAGANALLVNVLSYGFSVVEELAKDPEVNVPIFAHPSLAGAWCGAPQHGFSYRAVLGRLMSHAGVDAVLYPAHYGSLPFEAEEEFAIRDILIGRGVFPVPSAGIHPGVVGRVFENYGDDVILNAGTGIMEHPDGPAAGVRAFFEAIELVKSGITLAEGAALDGPLARALAKWGT